jgi:gluconokinase
MVIVLMGVSGSGKTTIGQRLAERLGWAFHDADAYHPPSNVKKMSRGQPLSDADRQPWLQTLARMTRDWIDRGENAILGCSALTAAARRALGTDHPQVRLVHLRGSFDLIEQRLRARKDHFMPPGLLASQFETLEEPAAGEAWTLDIARDPHHVVDDLIARLNLERRDA